MAATASEAYMLELVAQGCEWIKSEQGGAPFSKYLFKMETQNENSDTVCHLSY